MTQKQVSHQLALFDFDGTLTTEDIYTLFIKHEVSWHRKVWGKCALAPFYIAYKLGLLAGPKMRAIATFISMSGRKRQTVEAQGRVFAEQVIQHYYLDWAMQRMRWHQAQGHEVVVVSASLDAYLTPWCESQKVALICSELAGKTRLTGTYKTGDCTKAAKAEKVLQRYQLDQFSKVFAYGNTEEDNELLALAHERYMNGVKLS
ncbi:HAD-IB family phosphatase [Salinibius halmophilus]|uniref:HAD-IB family phosphatase n=1 Tax=Salinibius halmophilus TaxID=1853216 RepID=UPI000E668B1C|nr:HAD-IB family phosphatase [Salinibius halmophilus]